MGCGNAAFQLVCTAIHRSLFGRICNRLCHCVHQAERAFVMTFWENACNNARNKDLQEQLDSVVANCSLTVRCPARVSWVSVNLFFHFADFRLLHHCISKRFHVVPVAAVGRGVAAVLLAPIRLVLRAYGLRELRGCCDVGNLDTVPCQSLQSKPSDFFANSKSIAEFGGIHVACRWALKGLWF